MSEKHEKSGVAAARFGEMTIDVPRLTNIIRSLDGFGIGQTVLLFAEGDGAHQEEHVPRDEAGVLQPLFVLEDFAFAAATISGIHSSILGAFL